MPLTRPTLTLLIAAAALAGCARFPELEASVTAEGKAAPEPVLVDNRPLLAAAAAATVDTTTEAALRQRADALQGRSTALAGPVIGVSEMAEIEASHSRLREEAARVAPRR